jgi:hypothetical protein
MGFIPLFLTASGACMLFFLTVKKNNMHAPDTVKNKGIKPILNAK